MLELSDHNFPALIATDDKVDRPSFNSVLGEPRFRQNFSLTEKILVVIIRSDRLDPGEIRLFK